MLLRIKPCGLRVHYIFTPSLRSYISTRPTVEFLYIKTRKGRKVTFCTCLMTGVRKVSTLTPARCISTSEVFDIYACNRYNTISTDVWYIRQEFPAIVRIVVIIRILKSLHKCT